MTDLRRLAWILPLALCLATAGGCSSARWRPINEELEREGSGLFRETGEAVTGYRLHDGPEVDFRGWARLAGPDSLVLWGLEQTGPGEVLDYEPGAGEQPKAVAGPTLPLSEVSALELRTFSAGKTFLAVMAFPVGLAALMVAAWSGPF